MALKSAVPHTAVWLGDAPKTAADFAAPGNWACYDAAGDEMQGAIPDAVTTVVIPQAAAATFTVPAGSPTWGGTVIGGGQFGDGVHPSSRWGRKGSNASLPGKSDFSWRAMNLLEYAPQGEGNVTIVNRTGNDNAPVNPTMQWSQFRFDGWFFVTADQAGTWSFNQWFDDFTAFAIDGVWVVNNASYAYQCYSQCSVSAGWHRYTLVCGDTYGGWSVRSKITQDVFWLGHSFWNDADASADYDEVRVWNGVLCDEAIALSAAAGPDATAEQLAALAAKNASGASSLRTIELAEGAVLDLGGNTLVQPAIAGCGAVATGAGGKLVVAEKFISKVGESITASGEIDISNASFELADVENLKSQYTFLEPEDGATLSVSGRFRKSNLPKGWVAVISPDGTGMVISNGFTLFVR